MPSPEQIARVVHEANRAYQQVLGETPAPPWDEVPGGRQRVVIGGVEKALAGDDPEDLHNSWCEAMRADGWTHGDTKDDEVKVHPCLVPYDDLPEEQRRKDDLLISIVGALDDRPADMSMPFTVYVSIGNSDDKLTQREWSEFVGDVDDAVCLFADTIHGSWYSLPNKAWQNACWAFEVNPVRACALKDQLARLADRYRQDSIAYAFASPQFIRSEATPGAGPQADPALIGEKASAW
jgi:hypothetical protein